MPTFLYEYDLFGNVICITDPKENRTCKTYNLRRSPTKITYPDGTIELFKYDSEGSLHRSLTRDEIVTVYEYDYQGRQVYAESSKMNTDGRLTYLDGSKQYYSDFRCIEYRPTNNYIENYKYDASGRLNKVIKRNAHDYESSSNNRVTEIAYDSLGRIAENKVWYDERPEDYALEHFDYDLLNNILEKRILDAKGNILLRKGFGYDINGRCIEEYIYQNNKKNTILINTYYSEHKIILV